MSPKLWQEIAKFRALEDKYQDIGLESLRIEGVFQTIIKRALQGRYVDFSKFHSRVWFDWNRCKKVPRVLSASGALASQAEKIYDLIRKSASKKDREELEASCVGLWNLC